MADAKVRVDSVDAYFYPDVVFCPRVLRLSQDEQVIELYRRQSDITWQFIRWQRGAVVELECVKFHWPIEGLYDGTDVIK